MTFPKMGEKFVRPTKTVPKYVLPPEGNKSLKRKLKKRTKKNQKKDQEKEQERNLQWKRQPSQENTTAT